MSRDPEWRIGMFFEVGGNLCVTTYEDGTAHLHESEIMRHGPGFTLSFKAEHLPELRRLVGHLEKFEVAEPQTVEE